MDPAPVPAGPAAQPGSGATTGIVVATPATNDPGYELVDVDLDDGPVRRRRPPLAYPVDDGRLKFWVRCGLVCMAAVFASILVVAVCLNPYNPDGTARTMATHTQLGLPQCNMVQLIGKPCPSCGMTTSFTLLAHGDVSNSLRANWVGTLLALFWFSLIPWGLWSAVRGRYLWIGSGEAFAAYSVIIMLVLMLGRWGAVLLSD
ncbi:DUF2752 domain-containing protein [Fimbriiglobus ruber]|uniref:DUF2752 domain-containing protein n=1 Tax=Fimbriiglobus ruber TaxID=1908690 RepID=A0A225DA62_9BACT|nr:DUF2752 domain-containing protein [Fimbriiglobus ruber]OWK38451.1 hypothetical protein FRUB_07571 [Fimbriiglobus ruber]